MAIVHDEHPAGFTLLELLVALIVVGFLLVGLAQGVHFGLLSWTTEARLTNRNDGFSTVDEVLRHIVEGANPGDDVSPAPFVGSRSQLQCITAFPTVGPGTSRRMQAMLLVDADHRLVLRWRPYVHAIRLGSPAPLTDTELLSGVARLEIEFWRRDIGWVSAWRSPDLPRLVRFRLLFAAGDDRHWPDIIAAPLLDRP